MKTELIKTLAAALLEAYLEIQTMPEFADTGAGGNTEVFLCLELGQTFVEQKLGRKVECNYSASLVAHMWAGLSEELKISELSTTLRCALEVFRVGRYPEMGLPDRKSMNEVLRFAVDTYHAMPSAFTPERALMVFRRLSDFPHSELMQVINSDSFTKDFPPAVAYPLLQFVADSSCGRLQLSAIAGSSNTIQ